MVASSQTFSILIRFLVSLRFSVNINWNRINEDMKETYSTSAYPDSEKYYQSVFNIGPSRFPINGVEATLSGVKTSHLLV